jgi:hypothetical protein
MWVNELFPPVKTDGATDVTAVLPAAVRITPPANEVAVSRGQTPTTIQVPITSLQGELSLSQQVEAVGWVFIICGCFV